WGEGRKMSTPEDEREASARSSRRDRSTDSLALRAGMRTPAFDALSVRSLLPSGHSQAARMEPCPPTLGPVFPPGGPRVSWQPVTLARDAAAAAGESRDDFSYGLPWRSCQKS